MSASPTCVSAIKGTHYRLVQLDVCGNPVTGTGGMQVVSKGFVQVAIAPQYDAGVEFFQRTADGTVCVNQMDDPAWKRAELTIDFCEINTGTTSYMVTARELTNGSPTTGTGFAMQEGTSSNRFSLEIWQKVAGLGACDPVTGLQRYIYHAFPNCGSSTLGNYTVSNTLTQLEVVCQTRAISMSLTNGWAVKNGSTQWLQSGYAPGQYDHWYFNVTETPPPSPSCTPLAAL
jgi:hypothetical protein